MKSTSAINYHLNSYRKIAKISSEFLENIFCSSNILPSIYITMKPKSTYNFFYFFFYYFTKSSQVVFAKA